MSEGTVPSRNSELRTERQGLPPYEEGPRRSGMPHAGNAGEGAFVVPSLPSPRGAAADSPRCEKERHQQHGRHRAPNKLLSLPRCSSRDQTKRRRLFLGPLSSRSPWSRGGAYGSGHRFGDIPRVVFCFPPECRADNFFFFFSSMPPWRRDQFRKS